MGKKEENVANLQDQNVLTSEEKLKIQAEERYRLAIRNELDPPKQKSKKWEFLNSTFGIWLLSSIVVGLITWSYTTWNDSRKAEAMWSKIVGFGVEKRRIFVN